MILAIQNQTSLEARAARFLRDTRLVTVSVMSGELRLEVYSAAIEGLRVQAAGTQMTACWEMRMRFIGLMRLV
jgi:hypothetical protein